MRLKLLLDYEGGAYCGWQIQASPNPPPTIQGAVQAALLQLTGEKIHVHAAGRTDTGVHAMGQVAHCDVPDGSRDWRFQLNAVLPRDIRVLAATPVPSDFHAQHDAISKTYIYQFWQEQAFTPTRLRRFVWPCDRLNVEAIQSGLPLLVGKHDFASFQNRGGDVKNTVREILSITLESVEGDCWLPPHLRMLRLIVSGTGFLKQMVRNIAGFLAYIGCGKLAWDDLGAIMEARSRASLPSPTAPAKGLTLARVEYAEMPRPGQGA